MPLRFRDGFGFGDLLLLLGFRHRHRCCGDNSRDRSFWRRDRTLESRRARAILLGSLGRRFRKRGGAGDGRHGRAHRRDGRNQRRPDRGCQPTAAAKDRREEPDKAQQTRQADAEERERSKKWNPADQERQHGNKQRRLGPAVGIASASGDRRGLRCWETLTTMLGAGCCRGSGASYSSTLRGGADRRDTAAGIGAVISSPVSGGAGIAIEF